MSGKSRQAGRRIGKKQRPAPHPGDALYDDALAAAGLGVFEMDLATGAIVARSQAHDRIFGYDVLQPEWTLAATRAALVEDDRGAFDQALERTATSGELAFEGRLAAPAGQEVRWIELTGRAGPGGREGEAARLVGLVRDVTKRKRSAERERLLLAELQHRVRNTLAMLRAIARRTAEGAEDFEEYLAHLSGRIGALARVQGIATRWPWAGVDLWEVVSEELTSQLAREGEQVELHGPRVELPLRVGELLGLAIHELATNALKFGALSRPGARIFVHWQLESGTDGPQLRLDWHEQGVALDPAAKRRYGFGSELIERALKHELAAETRLDFAETGAHCRILLPLPEMEERV